jgi:phospholipid/cholesterol/gamma-HCH transport system ATP-binding protein
MAEAPVIRLEQLSYEIGNHVILDKVDLSIEHREIFAIIGMSGMGKTTLLRLMSGLIRPTSGAIYVLGEDITLLSEKDLNVMRKHVGLVFQYGALFDSLNVRENVGFRLYEQTRASEAEVRAAVKEKLHQVGMAGKEELLPAELSGGMQKRVGIARALIGEPEILLYDEPTSGLDPIIAANINELIAGLRRELGVTEVVVSHDMTSVLHMSDRIALLYEGKLLLTGTADEFRESVDPVVRQFLAGDTEGPIQLL